jgi:hypothetical protein
MTNLGIASKSHVQLRFTLRDAVGVVVSSEVKEPGNQSAFVGLGNNYSLTIEEFENNGDRPGPETSEQLQVPPEIPALD